MNCHDEYNIHSLKRLSQHVYFFKKKKKSYNLSMKEKHKRWSGGMEQ